MFSRQKENLVRFVQVCLVLSFFTPLIVGMRHLFPFVFPKALFFQFWVAVGLIGYLWLVLKDKAFLPKRSVLVFLLVIWGLSFLLAAVFGLNLFNSLWSKAERMDSLWFYAHLFVFCFMLLGILKTREDWLVMLKANTLIGILIGLVALLSKYSSSLKGLGDQTRLAGTFGNPAFLGTYFVIFVFLCLVLAQYAVRRKEKLWWLGCALFGLWLVLLSGTRGAYIGTAIGFGVWILGLFLFGSRQYRLIGAVLVSLAVLVAISFVIGRPPWEKFAPMIASRVYSSLSIPIQRVLVWQLGLKAFGERPLFGWGQENFIYAFNQNFNPEIFKYEVALFDRPHNKIVEVLVTAGAVGLITYVGLFLAIAWFLIRRLVQIRKKIGSGWNAELGVGIGLAGLWSAYQVQNLVLFEMPTSAIQLFFVLAFSIWFLTVGYENQAQSYESKGKPLFSHLWLSRGVFAVIAAVITWSLWAGTFIPYQASREFIKAMVYLSQAQTQEYFQQGRDWYFSARRRDTFLSREFDVNISRQLRSVVVPNFQEWRQSYVLFGRQVIDYLKGDMKRYPKDYDILVEMGNLMLDLETKYQDTQAGNIQGVLAQAMQSAPKRFEAYQCSFLESLTHNDEPAARQMLEQLFSLGPEVGDTWYYQALYDAQWGNQEKVIGDLNKAVGYGFALHNKTREQEWLLNLYVSRGKTDEALQLLEYWRTEPHVTAQYQLRYALLEIEVVYISGDIAKAKALLELLLARLPESAKPKILEYLSTRGINLGQ